MWHLFSQPARSLQPRTAFDVSCAAIEQFLFGEKVEHRAGLPASNLWEAESGGDLWSAVSRSELNEVPGNGPTSESPQKFPVNTPAPCLPFPLFQASALNHEFSCSPFQFLSPLHSAGIARPQHVHLRRGAPQPQEWLRETSFWSRMYVEYSGCKPVAIYQPVTLKSHQPPVVHSCIQQTFSEHILCAMPCVRRSQGQSNEQMPAPTLLPQEDGI